MDKWQPIETAPKDGRNILVAYRNALDKPRTAMAFFASKGTLECDDDRVADDDGYAPEGWYEAVWSHETTQPLEAQPTHWMPLPEPPQP